MDLITNQKPIIMKIGNFVAERIISLGTIERKTIIDTILHNVTGLVENVFYKEETGNVFGVTMYLNYMPEPVVIDNSTLSGVYKIQALFYKQEGFIEYNPDMIGKNTVTPTEDDELKPHPTSILNDRGWRIFREGTMQYSAKFWVNGRTHIKGQKKTNDRLNSNISIRDYETDMDDICISILSYLQTIQTVLKVKILND